MNAIVLALLLMTPQAAPPVPRQVPADSSGEHHKSEQQGKAEKPSANGLPVQKAPQASPTNDPHEDRAADDEERHVVVDRLPNKDPWDKTYIVLTAILVAVGISTLVGIWYQAIKTRDAVVATQAAAEATNRSVEMFVNKERARISVKPKRLITTPEMVVEYKITFYCPTPAIVEDVLLQAFAAVGGVGPGESMREAGIDRIIESSRELEQWLAVSNVAFRTQEYTKVMDGEVPLFFRGVIKYRDVFQAPNARPHELRFRYERKIEFPDIAVRRNEYWEKCGDDTENYET